MTFRKPTDNEDRVRELIRGAGRRPPVERAELAEITAHAREEWRSLVASRRSARRLAIRRLIWATAATFLVLVGLALWWAAVQPGLAPAVVIAEVESVSGAVWAVETGEASGRREPLPLGTRVTSGTWIETAEAGAPGGVHRFALRLAGGSSLRGDSGARLRLVAADRVELIRGTIYVDRGPAAGDVRVDTPLGEVRELGTQFEVRLWLADGEQLLRLRVREGSVEIRHPRSRLRAARGEELRLAADGLRSRSVIPTSGPLWDWVLETAALPSIEGMTLGAFLDWWARETGRRVIFADPALEASSRRFVLHGTLEDFTLAEAPEAVVAGAGLTWELVGEDLRISSPN